MHSTAHLGARQLQGLVLIYVPVYPQSQSQSHHKDALLLLLQLQVAGIRQPLLTALAAPPWSTWQWHQQLPCAPPPPASPPQARLAMPDHPSPLVPTTPVLAPAQTPPVPQVPQPCHGLSHR